MFCKISLIAFLFSCLITSCAFSSENVSEKNIYVAKHPIYPDLQFVMVPVSEKNIGFWRDFPEKQFSKFLQIFAENPSWHCDGDGKIHYSEINNNQTGVDNDPESTVNTETNATSSLDSVHATELKYAQMICLSTKFVPFIKTDKHPCKCHPNKVPLTPTERESCDKHECAIKSLTNGIREGHVAFEESIRLYNNNSQLWVVCALSGFGSEITPDKMSENILPHIEMVMTVFSAPEVNFTMHMGIARTVYHEEAAFKGRLSKHKNISPDLHAFAAKIMLSHHQKKWMCTRPVRTMRDILRDAFGENCYVGKNEGRVRQYLEKDKVEFESTLSWILNFNEMLKTQEGRDLAGSPLSFLLHENLKDQCNFFLLLNLEGGVRERAKREEDRLKKIEKQEV